MTSKYIYRYRNRIDIIAELLDAARGGTTKTKMMYKAMLSFGQLKDYLKMLAEHDLIIYDEGSQRFVTPDKGYLFMNRYEDLVKLIVPIPKIALKKKHILMCQIDKRQQA
jgi:predicted transcriptional regulator